MWSDPECCNASDKSKLFAEKAAWKFMEELKEEEKFDLVTILPGLMVGPSLSKNNYPSAELPTAIMNASYPGMPKVCMGFVDVKDVALAHLRAIQIKEAAGLRFNLSSESLWYPEVATLLHEEFGHCYKINTGTLKYCTLKLISFFDPAASYVLTYYNQKRVNENTKSKEILNIEY